MYGIDLITVCIAGKNQCAIDALNFLIKINNEIITTIDAAINVISAFLLIVKFSELI